MKSILHTAAAGVAIASLGISSSALAATAQADVEAEILSALTVTVDPTADVLNFGAIGESGTGGTVTVSTANAQTCSTGLVCDGLTAVPTFNVQGVAGSVVDVSLTNATETLTGPGGDTMDVGAFTVSSNQLNLDATTGQESFTVGGTLTVAAGQTPGAYAGTLEVVVVYN